MADTYRGLTIRIGGDTTDLKKALKGASQDASQLGRVLYNATKALKFDPTSVKAAQIRMDALGDKTTALYQKLEVLQKASKQLELSTAFREAKSYVEATGDSVGKAKARFNELDASLEKLKREFAELDGVDLSKQANYTEWNKKAQEHIELLRQGKQTENGLVQLDEKRYQTYKRLVDEQKQAQSQLDMTSQVNEYRKLQSEMAKVEAEAKSIASEYVDMKAKASVLDGAEFERLAAAEKEAKAVSEALDDQLRKVSDALDVNLKPIDLLKEKLRASENELSQVEAKMKAIASMEGIDTKAENVHANFQKWKTDLTESTTQLNAAKGKLSALTEEADRMKASLSGSVGSASWQKLQSEISKTKNEVSELTAKQKAAESGFSTAKAQQEYSELRTEAARLKVEVAEANAAMQKSSGLRMFATNATNIGLTLSTTVTPAVQRFLDVALSSAEEIDSAYRDMRKTVNGSEEDFEQLKAAAEDFSRTHVISADQVLEIEAMGGQLGIAVEDLQAFAETVSNLNIATNIQDAEEMSQKLGQLASITHMTSEEYDNFGDALVRLGNNEPALESDIVDITSRIGSMASICGMSVPDILALSTAVAATGQQSEAAGTAISNTMSDIEGAVAAGGDKLQAFADVAGTSAEEFAAKWENDPIEAIKAFIIGLKSIDDSGGSVDATLQNLGITGVRQKQALSGLTQTIDVLNDSITMSNDAWDGVSDEWGDAGDAAREAQKKAEGFSGQMSILENNVQVLGSTIGESLAPILGTVNDLFAAVTAAADNMTDGQKQLALGVMGVVTALGPALTAYGAIAPAVSKARKQQLLMNAAMEAYGVQNVTVGGRIAGFGSKLSNQTKVTGKAGAALNTAGTAIEKFGKRSALSKAKVVGLTTAAGGLAAVLVSIVGSYAIEQLSEYVDHLNKVKSATDGVKNAQKNAEKAAYGTKGAFEQVADAASEVGDAYEQANGGVLTYTDAISGATEASKNAAEIGANLAETLNSTWSDYYTNESLVQSYVDTIKELGTGSELTADQQVRLQQAVEGYNEKTGASIEVTDLIHGKLSETTEEIQKNADAWLQNAKMQALQSASQSTLEALVKQETELSKAKDAVSEANDKLANSESLSSQELEQAREVRNQNIQKMKESQDAINANKEALAAYTAQMADGEVSFQTWFQTQDKLTEKLRGTGIDVETFAAKLEQLGYTQDKLTENPDAINSLVAGYSNLVNYGMDIDSFKQHLSDLGVSQETLAAMTPEQLGQVAAAYDGSNNSVQQSINALKGSVGNDGQEIGQNYVEGVTTGLDNTGSATDKVKQLADDLIRGFCDLLGIHSPSTVMAEKGADVVSGIEQGLSQSDSLTTAAQNLGNTVINGITGALSNGYGLITGGVDTVMGWVRSAAQNGSDASSAGQNLVNTMAGGISGVIGTVTSTASSMAQSATGAASASSNASGAGATVSSTFGSGINVSGGNARAMALANQSVRSALGSAQANSAGSKLSSTFGSGINVSGGNSKAGAMAKGAVNSVRSNANATSSGQYLAQGFAQGISSWAHTAINAAANLARSVVSTIKRIGGEGSPWKTTIESGKFAAQGLAIGMEKYSDEAVREAEKMAERVVKAADASAAAGEIVEYAGRVSSGEAFGGRNSDLSNGLGSANNGVQVVIDGVTVNDYPEMVSATRDYLTELHRIGQI